MFVSHLPAIDRITGALCRRHGIPPSDQPDVLSAVRLHLIRDDYAVLARYRGDAALTTYLTVVIAMAVRSWCQEQWGRWRPSAAALREGPVAVMLERLLHRDGLPFVEAARILREKGMTSEDDRALRALLGRLPRRPAVPRLVSTEELAAPIAADGGPDSLVESAESTARLDRVEATLRQVLDTLPREDAAILRLHYLDGATLADIARVLGVPQKPLYRRLPKLLEQVRRRLADAGITAEAFRDCLGT